MTVVISVHLCGIYAEYPQNNTRLAQHFDDVQWISSTAFSAAAPVNGDDMEKQPQQQSSKARHVRVG
jgi:hypothetical protein